MRLSQMIQNSDRIVAEPNPVDLHVGERLRKRRKEVGLSQTDLGQSVGLTFQQIQKYERGSNRISASKIYEFAQFLDVPVSYFFTDLQDREQATEAVGERVVSEFYRHAKGKNSLPRFLD